MALDLQIVLFHFILDIAADFGYPVTGVSIYIFCNVYILSLAYSSLLNDAD